MEKEAKKYVRGLDGIAELFGVHRITAWRYKNTFLAPAVKQRGRVILTDVEEALRLFDQKTAAEDGK